LRAGLIRLLVQDLTVVKVHLGPAAIGPDLAPLGNDGLRACRVALVPDDHAQEIGVFGVPGAHMKG